MKRTTATIVWFRKDLRLHDHPALWEAAKNGVVIPLFIWSKQDHEEYVENEGASWWLYHSLKELKECFHARGLDLIIKSGDDFEVITELMAEFKAEAFYFNERYEPEEIVRQDRLAAQLDSIGLEVERFQGNLLFSPNLLNGKGEPYKVFTSFWKRCMQEIVEQPYPVPFEMRGFDEEIRSIPLDSLGLHEGKAKFSRHWKPGEQAAIAAWRQFSEAGLLDYKEERDLISSGASSRLSPYIVAGNISVKAIWHSARSEQEEMRETSSPQAIEAFLKQLIWREFAYHQLIHHPEITRLPLRQQFMNFPWIGTEEQFIQWK